jgi:hypothetical protein
MKLRYSMKEKLEILDTIKPLVEKLDVRLHATAKLPDEVMKLDAVKVNDFLKACEAAHTKYFLRVAINKMKTGKELLAIKQDLESVCKDVYA